jgi:hypothetical protein
MLKQEAILIVTIVSIFVEGCSSDHPGAVVHRCRVGSYELRIIRTKRDLENPHLYYELAGGGRIIKQRTSLGVEQGRYCTFSSVVDREGGVVAIVEDAHPTVFVAAFDLNTLEVWPDWDATPDTNSALEERVAKGLENLTGKKGWRGGVIVTVEPTPFP